MKRRASRTVAHPPSKLFREDTVTSLNKALSNASKVKSDPRPPVPSKWPSLRRRSTGVKEVTKTDTITPELRRASTLTLEHPEDIPASSSTGLRKATSILETDDIMTTVTQLPSGSTITKTYSIENASNSVRKELSKTLSKSKTHLLKPSNTSSAPVPFLPPGGLFEIVFSFDTTSSMYCCLTQIRDRVQDMIQRLQADIPGIRIAVAAHGDYCDKKSKYVLQLIDFGATVPELCDFVRQIEGTFGGDLDECYELVMQRVRTGLSWTPNSQRALVMIGDADPHEKDYVFEGFCPNIDWREELQHLKEMGVRIYGVKANGETCPADGFWKVISKETNGLYLQMEKFDMIFETLMAICYREGNTDILQDYLKEVEAENGSKMKTIFGTLRKAGDPTGSSCSEPFTFKASGVSAKKFKPIAKVGLKETTKASNKKVSTKKMPTGASKKPKTKTKKVAMNRGVEIPKTVITKGPSRKAAKKKIKVGKEETLKKKSVVNKKKAPRKKTKVDKKKTPAKRNKKNTTALQVNAIKSKSSKTKSSEVEQSNPKKKTTRKYLKKYRENTQLRMSYYQRTPLAPLECSGWELGIAPEKVKNQSTWKPRPNGPGMRRVSLFKKHTDLKSIFEFAVTIPGRVKKYGVYYKICQGYKTNSSWDVYHLSQPSILKEINDIVSRGGSIYVRRFLFTDKAYENMKKLSLTEETIMSYLPNNYNYPWRRHLFEKNTRHRKVTRHGFAISHIDY
ncbi:uncharacterized protein LOC126818382 [Patella vulgata]|uniref:uncharacterized protein LOC126818382 n=1 Tax=Patella vulgata TaxID=6465 RepID=UPI0024A90215|nr:uncharacterized protein LOC126818382 [Patella vulgata]